MSNIQRRARNSVTLQERMFRLAKRDFGLSIPVLVQETGIPKSTLESWQAGTTMPAWALFALGGAPDKPLIPNYLLSLVAEPFGKHVGDDGADDSALHEAVTAASEVVTEYLVAQSPDSEGGPAVTPREESRIREIAERAGGKLRAVGAVEARRMVA